MLKNAYDILICWLNVHGGSWHKLIELRDRATEAGYSCAVLVCSDPPMGLQSGVDFDETSKALLAQSDIHILPETDIRQIVEDVPTRLFCFDANYNEHITELIRQAKQRGSLTAQLPSQLLDHGYHGADYVLVQHPLTLYFEIEWKRTSLKKVAAAKQVFATGCVLKEPVPNRWTSDLNSSQSFFEKYGLDPEKRLAMWLPDREDGIDPHIFPEVKAAAEKAGVELLMKMHPWEYKLSVHGFDPYGNGKTSAEYWGITAVEERDASWAYDAASLAMVRGSAVGLELAASSCPVLYLPSPAGFRQWQRLYARLTKESSQVLEKLEELTPTLLDNCLSDIDDATFRKVDARVHPDPARDSFELHLDAFRAILDGTARQNPMNSLSPVKAMYRGKLPLYSLRPRHRPAHLLSRLLARL